MDHAKETFKYVDHRIWWMLWRWALRRHPNKSKGWVKQRYYRTQGNQSWRLFDYDNKRKIVYLFQASSIPIQYHTPIRASANPFDPKDELYFEGRQDQAMQSKFAGRRRLSILYRHQKGICPVCKLKITQQTGWHTHHIIPKYLGGKSIFDNLVPARAGCSKTRMAREHL